MPSPAGICTQSGGSTTSRPGRRHRVTITEEFQIAFESRWSDPFRRIWMSPPKELLHAMNRELSEAGHLPSQRVSSLRHSMFARYHPKWSILSAILKGASPNKRLRDQIGLSAIKLTKYSGGSEFVVRRDHIQPVLYRDPSNSGEAVHEGER